MIQIAIELTGPPPAPPRLAPISTVGGGFEQMLAGLAPAPSAEQPVQLPTTPIALPAPSLPVERQDLAGEEDEEPQSDARPSEEKDEPEAPIWLPTLALPTPPPASKAPAALALAAESGRGDRRFAMDAPLAIDDVPPPPAEQPSIEIARRPASIEAPPPNAALAEPRLREPLRLPALAPAMLPASVVLQPTVQPSAPSGLEIVAKPEPVAELQATPPETIAATTAQSIPRVEASAGSQDAPLDMNRGDWMESMIEKIETLRAEGGERAALIRLRPDALGSVEVRIRHEGEQVHIHFTADSAAARTMLSDASPRLSDLAEARGLKLGDTGVGQGAGGERREAQQSADPRAPNRAPRPTSTAVDRSGERIA